MTATATMTVGDFDALEPAAAAEVILTCARIPRWADAVVGGRPYEHRDRLLKAARDLAADWSWADVDGALAAHPRIGERPSAGTGEAALSRAEQARVGGELAAELKAVNEAYEERFGRVLLVRAAGRSAPDILRVGVRRLLMDEATDRVATTGELRDIALRRLRGLIS